jgi:hypothetical protein
LTGPIVVSDRLCRSGRLPDGGSGTRVTHTYDWTRLADEKRFARARATTADRLQVSLDRLAALAERP